MRTCLLVDDSSVVRKIIRKIVEDLGFNVLEAYDGKNALEVCSQETPDIILLDWNMPVMDGMEFLKAYFPQKQQNGTKIIFCTTENDIMKIQLALSEGADEYIMKPFDADIIKTKFMQMGLL